MKKRFLTYMKKNIQKQYPNYNNDKIDEIMYGIEGLYLTLTKAVIIFTAAYFLGIFKELLLLLITFNIIRLFSFGMHASNSYICLIFSSTLFIGGTFLCKYITFNLNFLILIYILCLISIILFAPADTIKRPLINKKKRMRFKILSIIVVLTYFIASLFIENTLLVNCLAIGLIIESILILPITYKLFKLPYNNYKKYDLNTK